MKEISLKEMQEIELNLLLELDKVCRKHSIRYYMDGGTLLGAMCYEGFIPWDDDIDLKMPRPDYERFAKLGDELPEYISIDMPSPEHCEYTMMKLIDNRTVLREYQGNKVKTTGVYIDVFPMDGHPKDEEECREHLAQLSRLNTLFHMSLDGFQDMKAKGLKGKLKGIAYQRKYRTWDVYIQLTALAKKYEYDEASYVGLLVEGNPMKERFPKDWLKEGFELEFEGHMIPAPSGYRRHMEIFYGDHVTKDECYHNLPMILPDHKHEVYWKA